MATTSHLLPEHLEVWQNTLHWQPTVEQQGLFQQLYAGILAGNQQLNLTRITEPEEFWEKHLWDSLSGIAPWLSSAIALPEPLPLPPTCRVIDIGSGGGFPGLPVAIAQPHWQVSCLDSTRKKMAFLAELGQALGLSQLKTLADRAEAAGQHPAHREAYDLALIRAVGSASVCAEYALPLVAVGGVAVLYRGQWSADEAAALAAALPLLGGRLLLVRPVTTPLSAGTRHCLYIQKQQPTAAAFPRAVGLPGKQPLA